MKLNQFLFLAGASAMLTLQSCRTDEAPSSTGNYQNGIFITNEGNYGEPNSGVSFVSKDLSFTENDIYSKANGGEPMGDVLNSAGFHGNNAYWVMNNSNKIIVTDRYTMKKKSEITTTEQPRYMAFANNYIYVTENRWYPTEDAFSKLGIYDQNHNRVKTITFDRLSEKIVSASNYIYVQTDGTKYVYNGNTSVAVPTGHTISRINPTTNEVDKIITLNHTGMIKDMVESQGDVYVMSSSQSAGTAIFRVEGSSGNISKINTGAVGIGSKLAVDNGTIYILDSNKNIFKYNGVSTTKLFMSNASTYIYGFNVIDEKIYISEMNNFTSNSTISVHNAAGTLLKTFTTGIGSNGFYKN